MNRSRFHPPTSPEAPSGSQGPAGRSERKAQLLPSAEPSLTSVVASHPRRFHRVPEPKPLPPLLGVTCPQGSRRERRRMCSAVSGSDSTFAFPPPSQLPAPPYIAISLPPPFFVSGAPAFSLWRLNLDRVWGGGGEGAWRNWGSQEH